ncbi:uncharacterized protein J4E84_010300 [Alternaria hordeiaustralica]|uniref:uncharacterized protein n=1 Tax=Alternaria hordeiaustralica TaxID=1187925 RepID=UPI0020C2C980|nr:uncharacterized protein J4E84_010300 [Alternaria hordeiaustralica]KAI4674859.1 hypothetical protein J4E84_010300 [Alternaria hordeiaustralica]
MNPKSIYEETNKLYTPIREVGKGTCGSITFCVQTPSAASSSTTDSVAQSAALVAVKMISREMCRDRIADEIVALERVRSSLAIDKNNSVAKHFSTLIDYDPIKDGGSGWLVVSPVCGFDLERLRVVVTAIIQPSSETDLPRRFPLPAIPEVLILHVAKQLTEAVGWLHDAANISHNDVFGGNVMLDVSASSKEANFTLPTVVLIDFDRATLDPDNMTKGADRSYTYELIYMLDNAGRASSQEANALEDVIVPKESMTWWDAFRNFLVINKGQYLQDESASFAKFWGRFGADIDRRLESITEEEQRRVKELIDMVAKKEVRFPSEERVREVLGEWED